MKKIYLLLLVTSLLYSCDESPTEDVMNDGYNYLVGAYTDTSDQGIMWLQFDPDENLLSTEVVYAGIKNPSFVITNKKGDLAFAVEETGGENGGKVKSFKLDKDAKSLELLDTQDTFGDGPCYLALDPNEAFLVVGNYSGGNFSVFAIDEGKLSHVQTIAHEGQSINKSRQAEAHVHSLVFHPNGKQLLVADLGTDKIHLYDFKPDFNVPFHHANPEYIEVEAGSGPRHLIIHPNGEVVYLIHELTAEVGVYSYKDGQMALVQTVSLTSNDFAGNIGAAEIRFSPDHNFVYASNRGDANELVVFEIDKDYKLEFVQRIKSGGKMPRNFILTTDGKYLLAAHQESGELVVFDRDEKSGKISPNSLITNTNKPVYLFPVD